MNILQKVQNFLAEQYDPTDMVNHESIHLKQDPHTNHPSVRSGSLEARINFIRSGSLAAKVRDLISRTAKEEIPRVQQTRTTPLSDEEKVKLRNLIQSRRAQSNDPRGNNPSGSNLINPQSTSRGFYQSLANKIKLIEEVIGRIGPQTSSDLSAVYMKNVMKSEKTPEGKETLNKNILRLRNLIHGRIKEKMEDAARQFGSASIRTSEIHGNPYDIQAQNDLVHAQVKMQRHNHQLDRFVNAHDELTIKGAKEKFLTGDEMKRLTLLHSNLTKKQLGQLQQSVNAAQIEGEVGEVF
jgi:hypothetical protein